MTLSAVAGIVDVRGGLRIVVTEPDAFRHHVGPGELCYILPNVRVQEPLTIGQFAGMKLEQRVKDHIDTLRRRAR